jgi:non-specific protein-tyrosine kinase
MELAHYLRVLRRQWPTFCACVGVGIAAAALIAALSTPTYESRAQLFVSSGGAARDLDATYEGGLLAQQRARSYVELVDSPGVARAVIEELGLSESPAQVQRQLAASVPVDTVLIDVTASAESARRAKDLADAVTAQLPRFVRRLETAPGERAPPVELSVASRPELPADPASPRAAVYLALGLLLGLALGVAAAVLRDALDDRVRTDEQAAAAAGVPVVGSIEEGSPESYRRLRSSLTRPAAADGVRLLLTSTAAEPATARAAVELGAAFADAGRSVVLVDANLWRPKLGELLGISASAGLAQVLRDGLPVEDALQPSVRDGRIEVLPAGAQVLPGSDALESSRLADALDSLADRADVVIIDSPALLNATDAAVLAPLTAGVLVLTRLSSTRAQQLEAAVRELDAVGAEIIGLVTLPPTRWPGRSRRRGLRASALATPGAGPVRARTGGGR